MNIVTKVKIIEMAKDEGLSPYKIAMILGVASSSVLYVLDHKGHRAKSKARAWAWQKKQQRAAP